nr:hypothetical protein [Tanacetum cinerariifolium]
EVQEVVDVVTTAKLITKVVTAASTTIIAAEEPKPLKKQAQIEQDEKYARELEAELNKNIDWDEVIDQVKKKAKEDPAVKRSVHGLAKVKGWKLLESCGVQIITFTTTQLILLVERKYPLIRFTLDQMLNAAKLEVEEESEVSLELLRFIRQQHQEGG